MQLPGGGERNQREERRTTRLVLKFLLPAIGLFLILAVAHEVFGVRFPWE